MQAVHASSAVSRLGAIMWRWSPPLVAVRVLRSLTVRQWKIALIVFTATFVLGMGTAVAADENPAAGIESFMSIPDYSHGGSKTLAEDIPTSRYTIDHNIDNNPVNIVDKAGNGLVNTIWSLTVALAQFLMVLISWLLGNTDVSNDTFNIADMVSNASVETMTWLFPTCLAIAGVAVWLDHQRDKTGATSLLTVGIIGVIAAGFSLFPSVFVGGMDTVRSAGNSVVTAAMPDQDNEVSAQPFAYGEADYSQNTDNEKFTRQVTDTLWRSAVVTPWCMVEFGNLDACRSYGSEMLTRDNPDDRRDDVIRKQIFKDDSLGGKDGDVGRWVHGKDWPQRLGMAFVALIVTCVLMGMSAILVFTAIIAFIQAVLLLFLGSIFLIVGMIPGAPRKWLGNWTMAFAGAVLASVLTMLLLVATMGAVTGIFLNPDMPWAQGFGLATLTLAAALGLRSVIKNIGNYASDSTGSGTASRLLRTLVLRRALSGGRSRGGANAGTSSGKSDAGNPGRDTDSRGTAGPNGRSRGDVVQNRMQAANVRGPARTNTPATQPQTTGAPPRGSHAQERAGSGREVPTSRTQERAGSTRAVPAPRAQSSTAARGQGQPETRETVPPRGAHGQDQSAARQRASETRETVPARGAHGQDQSAARQRASETEAQRQTAQAGVRGGGRDPESSPRAEQRARTPETRSQPRRDNRIDPQSGLRGGPQTTAPRTKPPQSTARRTTSPRPSAQQAPPPVTPRTARTKG